MQKDSFYLIVFLLIMALLSACSSSLNTSLYTLSAALTSDAGTPVLEITQMEYPYPVITSIAYPFNLATTAIPKSIEIVHLTAEKPMIVRSAPDVNADTISQIPAGQPYPVLGRYIDWWLIDFGDNQTGWVYGATSLTQLTGEPTWVPTIDLPSPRFVTPTPLCTPQSVQDIDQALSDAQSTLVAFFDRLSRKEYDRAAEFFGGDIYILRESNPLIDPKDYATLFQHACEINGYQCIQVKRVVDVKVISPFRFEFVVEFKQPDGSLFILGPCCGGNETDQPPKSRWKYTVVLDCQGRYFVMDLPQYIP